MEITRKKRPRIYENVVEQIQQLILDGTLTPGDQLLPERQLAEKLGVSRTAVREALTALVSLGLIEITPGSGAHVKEAKIDALIDPLAAVLLKETKNVFDLLEARLILETGAARMAAERANRTDLFEMQQRIMEMEQDVREGREANESDTGFHFCISRAAKNPVVESLMAVLTGLMNEYYGPSRKKLLAHPKGQLWCRQHTAVYEAIRDGDPARAAEAMSEHLTTTLQELKAIQGWPE